MTRARVKSWIVWLLPLMLLRAFVPMGFMLSSEGGTLAITFCSSIAAPTASDEHAAHHHHDGQLAAHHHHGSEAHERSLCPYGLTGPAQVASDFQLDASAPIRERTLALRDSRHPSLTPSQTEPIRGPPIQA
jgi:hypothetical protein